MAASSKRTNAAVDAELRSAPHRFEFFQAVRLLQRIARGRRTEHGLPLAPLGHEGPPRDESLRLRALVSHTFPTGQIASIRPPASRSEHVDENAKLEMTVAFLGLTGPVGTLPEHYTQLMIDRTRHKDFALRDFFDLFNHRTASLFHRAWEKYRFALGFEWSALGDDPLEDLFTRCLYCFVGLGSGEQAHGDGALRRRLEVRDEAFLYYSGFFAHHPRNAASLEAMVQDYWRLPTRVLQFQGQWLRLSPEDQTRMPGVGFQLTSTNTRLGVDTIVGERVWSVESRFRLRFGPLPYREFRRFTPLGDRLIPLGQLVRMYVGQEFDFDVQPILLANEVPNCRLGGPPEEGSRLGWNTWLQSTPRKTDAADAVFIGDGSPTRKTTQRSSHDADAADYSSPGMGSAL